MLQPHPSFSIDRSIQNKPVEEFELDKRITIRIKKKIMKKKINLNDLLFLMRREEKISKEEIKIREIEKREWKWK